MALIGKIRERVGLLVFIIAIAIMAFLLMDVTANRMGAGQQPTAGTIDGEAVNYQDYEAKVNQIMTNYRNSQIDVDDATRLQIREQAWTQYVQEVLSKREFEKLGLDVTEEELKQLLLTGQNAQLRSVPLFQNPETGQFDQERLRQYVESFNDPNIPINERQSRLNQWKTFEESVIQNQMLSKYTTLIKKGIYAPEWLANKDYADKNRKANINYVFVPYTSIDDGEIAMATDDELKSYISNNKHQFKQDETRVVDFVSFPIRASRRDTAETQKFISERVDGLSKAEDEGRFLKMHYSDTPLTGAYLTKAQLTSSMSDSLFSVPAGTVLGPYMENGAYIAAKMIDRKMVPDSVEIRQIQKNLTDPNANNVIDSLKNVVDSGGDFEGLASAFSDDGSKEEGGYMGYIQPGVLPEAMNNAVFYEYGRGDVFTVETPNAWHLVEVITSRPSSEAVKVAFLSREIEASKQTTDSIYSVANRFAGLNRSVDEFNKAAEEAGYTVQTSPPLTKNE